MLLKRIELEGFKSFADRTVVPMDSGLTGIVGPNGCGKSNVVDALLWVMGERSTKILRADSMEDVIFEGAEGRAGAPYSMVEIILEDPSGEILDLGGETAVGRRLFRTGESEFLINGRKVRRKDVRDLLLRCGLGVRGYMVLAQGKIDAVLAANPKDRRAVLEEAAGISRYKARKHETLLKLASVGQNLDRVDDVLGEVQRAVRKLRFQASKAQRFVEIRERYRELRVQVALGDESRHRLEERSLRAKEKELEDQVTSVRTDREQSEERLRELRNEEEALRTRYEELRSRSATAKERAAGLEERVHGLEARATELEQRANREAERLEGLLNTERARETSETTLAAGLAALLSELDQARGTLGTAETGFDKARAEQRVAKEEIETLRRGVLEALAERTQHHNEVGEAVHRRSEMEGALKALERRAGERTKESELLDCEAAEAQKILAAAQARVDSAEGEAAELVHRRDAARAAVDEHLARLRAAEARAAEARTRLEALASVEEAGEGLPEQVRDLLKNRPRGIAGLLLEGVQVPAPWDRLLENLLGRSQHGLWSGKSEPRANLGAGEFDLFFPLGKEPTPVHLATAKPLRQLLEGDPKRCEAICARLGEVYCVDSGEEAIELAARHPGALFLSQDGEVHGPGFARVGMLTGDGAGLLARRNSKNLARTVLSDSETERKESESAETAARRDLSAVEEQLETVSADLRGALSERDRAQARLAETDRRLAAVEEERRALRVEELGLRTQFDEAAADEERAKGARDRAEEQRAERASKLESSEEEIGSADETFESARSALQEARILFEGLQHQVSHKQEKAAESRLAAERNLSERGQLEGDLKEIRERVAGLRQEAEGSRTESRELLSDRAGLDERVSEARTQCERAATALARDMERREAEAGRLEGLLEQRQELALGLQRTQMQREELARGIQEEFHQSLDALARSLALDPAAFQAEDDAHEAQSAELAEMRTKLDSYGSVNLEAVRELEEREERLGFLEREREDLVSARKKLEQTLEDLDRECRTRFVETFETVKEHFESIFRRLFRGGRAELELTADEDPLDAGIEISVRPPGKELRSINLLSGGERTLTALALLLSVFRSRPSPFCLLDEVDAALDDANVERFLDVLKDFTKGTQFIVVTHNRITMSHCQRLFGVTMRRRGVSQVVSVDLDEMVAATRGSEGEITSLPGEESSEAATAPAVIPAAPRIPKEVVEEVERETAAEG